MAVTLQPRATRLGSAGWNVVGWAARALTIIALMLASLTPQISDAGLKSYERVRVLEPARQIDDAKLTDQDGNAYQLLSLKGKVAFILFGFTNCPDVCPMSMERLRALHDSGVLKGGDVAYVMISVDGERDSPAAMKSFLAKYSKGFIGLTGDPSVVKAVAAQFSAAFFKGAHKHGSDAYDVSHSPQIFVLDAAGRLRAEVYGASVDTMADLAKELLGEKG